MLSEIDNDIQMRASKLDAENQVLRCLRNSFEPMNSIVLIQEDMVIELEKQLANLQIRRCEYLQLKDHQSLCSHEFVTDLIDIDPDRSKTIIYCKHCHFCK